MAIDLTRPLPVDYLSGQLGGASEEGELVSWLNTSRAGATSAVTHIYADSVNGDDDWDGSELYPVASFQRAMDLVPFLVQHIVVVHLDGEFALPLTNTTVAKCVVGGAVLSYYPSEQPKLIIDGGASTTKVFGPYTATAASVSSIVVNTAGWTVDSFAGYMIKITSGPAIGKVHTVQGNTADTVTPCKNWSIDPGVGATFEIVKPSTTLTKGALSYANLRLCNVGTGVLCLQRVTLTGGALALDGSGVTTASGIHDTVGWLYSNSYGLCYIGGSLADPSNGAKALTDWNVGVGGSTLSLRRGRVLGSVGSSVFTGAVLSGVCIWTFDSGTRIIGNALFGACFGERDANESLGITISNSSGYATTKFGGNLSGAGITLRGCRRFKFGAFDCGGNSTYGIDIGDSEVEFSGVVTSTVVNGVAGVRAHSGSLLKTKAGSPPTITGTTAGDATVDGTSLATTWAAIDSGTPLVDLNELVQIKKI